jgi:hypothetical protein
MPKSVETMNVKLVQTVQQLVKRAVDGFANVRRPLGLILL